MSLLEIAEQQAREGGTGLSLLADGWHSLRPSIFMPHMVCPLATMGSKPMAKLSTNATATTSFVYASISLKPHYFGYTSCYLEGGTGLSLLADGWHSLRPSIFMPHMVCPLATMGSKPMAKLSTNATATTCFVYASISLKPHYFGYT
ncbi:hypothetical protein CFOL_v3_10615, partial [Cephalotus follicularis]